MFKTIKTNYTLLIALENSPSNLPNAIEHGLKLTVLGRQLNKLLSPFLMVHFCSALLATVCCSYGLSSIMFYPITPLRIYFSVTFAIWTFESLSLLYFACAAGEKYHFIISFFIKCFANQNHLLKPQPINYFRSIY